MPFMQAIDPTLAGQIDANGVNDVCVVRSVLLLGTHAEPLDHPQEEPELQGWPRGERRHDPGQHRQRRRRRVPERREGYDRLRVRRYPGDRVEERRQQVRPEQEERPRAGSPAARHPLRRDASRACRCSRTTRSSRRRSTGPSTGRRSRPRVDTCTASARGRSCRRACSATSRRASIRSGSRPTRLKTAKKLAAGNLRGGKAVLWASNTGIAPLQAQLIQFNLKQMGLDAEIRLLPRAQQFTNAGNPKTAEFDLTIERWGADYADPYDFINILLDGAQVDEPAAQQLRVLQRLRSSTSRWRRRRCS